MESVGFEILFEEGPCLVVNKPAGILTQSPPGIDSLEVRIKNFLIERENKPGKAYLGVPHRLDRPVSGAIVVAKHVRAARRLSEQFEGRIVRKMYWAVVEGNVPDESGKWIDSVCKVHGQAQGEVVAEDHPNAKSAVLSFQVKGRFDGMTWLEIALETGRYHQIRVQTSSHGFPVVGDDLYGATTGFGAPAENRRDRVIALHARDLAFRHPMTQEDVNVTAPLPAMWQDFACDELKAIASQSS